MSATVCWASIRNRDCILYPGVGTCVLIRPAQTFYERIMVMLFVQTYYQCRRELLPSITRDDQQTTECTTQSFLLVLRGLTIGWLTGTRIEWTAYVQPNSSPDLIDNLLRHNQLKKTVTVPGYGSRSSRAGMTSAARSSIERRNWLFPLPQSSVCTRSVPKPPACS